MRRATALNVGGAFHTPLMASAAAGIAVGAGATFTFDRRRPRPIVANQDGAAYLADESGTATAGATARPRT